MTLDSHSACLQFRLYGNQYKIHPACPASATHSLDHKTKFIGHHHLTSQDAPIKLPLGVDEMINGDFLIGLPAGTLGALS